MNQEQTYFHFSLFTVYRLLFTVYRSPFTVHCLPFTVHRSPLTSQPSAINTSAHQHINTSTHQHISFQLSAISSQKFRVPSSKFRVQSSLLTFYCLPFTSYFSSLKNFTQRRQDAKSHFSAISHQHINTSAHQHISTSTHQHINKFSSLISHSLLFTVHRLPFTSLSSHFSKKR